MTLWDKLKQSIRNLATNEEGQETEKESSEPWVQVLGADPDPENGIKIELDWNQAFVDYLREQGIVGTEDEQVVQRWLTLLLQEMTEESNEDVVPGDGSEFE